VSKIVVSQFVTLDGVVDDPGGSDALDRGGWAFRFDRGDVGNKFKLEEVKAGGALLLGRVTYLGFAKAWPSRSDEVGFADKMNSMPKYVVSTTLDRVDWNNSTLIRTRVVDEIRSLKERVAGDILVNGSVQLVQTLIEHDLVDEYRLMVFPVVLGSGKRLFPDEGKMVPLRLTDATRAGECMILIFQPARTDTP
jgi:dihydrofolate reductase